MTLNYFINDIIKFLREQDFLIDPLPTIVLSRKENDPNNLLIKTGYYDASSQKIVVFTSNRHMKDILRSFVHEMVHHHQYLTDKINYMLINKGGKLKDNQELRQIESEAFLYGNLYFRMYTEQFKEDL